MCTIVISYYFVQISTNGLISFDRNISQFRSYTVASFPRRSPPYLPLIAPLWADFNFRDSGIIYYRLATDRNTLEAVADVITSLNPNYSEFRPTLAVVVTWFQSKFLRSEVEVSYRSVTDSTVINNKSVARSQLLLLV